MPGSYDHDERKRIRREMDEARPWIDAHPDDPPAAHPDAVFPAKGRIYVLTPGQIDDVDFPLSSEALMIGEPHDECQGGLGDRREANCPFVFAARTGASTAHGVGLATLLSELRMSLDIPLRQQWREIREMELFAIDVDDVRTAVRTRHPGMRGGIEELRRASSGDPEYDEPTMGAEGAATATGTATASKEALSSSWKVARSAVGELHAPIIYVATPFVTPGGGYLFAVHPLQTLSSWGLAGCTHQGTLREAGVRFFSLKMLTQRDPDRNNTLVLPHQIFPLFVHFCRRKINGAASLCKRVAKAVRHGVASMLGPKRLLTAIDYLGAWAALVREARLVTNEVRLLLGALVLLALAVLGITSGHI